MYVCNLLYFFKLTKVACDIVNQNNDLGVLCIFLYIVYCFPLYVVFPSCCLWNQTWLSQMTDCSSAGGSHGDQNNPALVQKGMVSDLPGERFWCTYETRTWYYAINNGEETGGYSLQNCSGKKRLLVLSHSLWSIFFFFFNYFLQKYQNKRMLYWICG